VLAEEPGQGEVAEAGPGVLERLSAGEAADDREIGEFRHANGPF
jgi:hypothetical protein